MLGRPADAVAPLELSIDLATANQFGWWGNFSVAALSSAKCGLGDVEAARRGWDETLAKARAMHDGGMEAAILQQRATMLAEVPDADPGAILQDLERAAGLDEEIGARPRLASVLVQQAAILERLGRNGDAEERRSRADALYAEMGLAPSSQHVGSPG